jgi:hypothetical protein
MEATIKRLGFKQESKINQYASVKPGDRSPLTPLRGCLKTPFVGIKRPDPPNPLKKGEPEFYSKSPGRGMRGGSGIKEHNL